MIEQWLHIHECCILILWWRTNNDWQYGEVLSVCPELVVMIFPSYTYKLCTVIWFQEFLILIIFTELYGLIYYSLILIICTQLYNCPVSWGCRIHWLHLCRGVRPPPNECPGYNTKQSDGEVPAVLELWGIRSTPSLPSLPGPLWPGVVALDRALSMG